MLKTIYIGHAGGIFDVVIGLRLSIVLLSVLTATPVTAAQRNIFTDKRAGFSIEYPAKWLKSADHAKMRVLISPVDQQANVMVASMNPTQAKSAESILFDIEMGLVTLHGDDLSSHKLPIPENLLRIMRVDEGFIGTYRFVHAEIQMRQYIMVLTKGQKVYVVVTVHTENAGSDIDATCRKIRFSFRTAE